MRKPCWIACALAFNLVVAPFTHVEADPPRNVGTAGDTAGSTEQDRDAHAADIGRLFRSGDFRGLETLLRRLHDTPPGQLKKLRPGGSSSGVAKADFNGDGFADLAIGVPGEDTPVGVFSSGAVIVIYGSASGLVAPTTAGSIPAAQFWSQNSDGTRIPDASEAADRFGSALAAGDFNADGFSDLAIGAPADKIVRNGIGSVGAVTVIYGSPNGLTTDPAAGVPAAQQWALPDFPDLGDLLLFGAAREADVANGFSFGAALAWGDFNGDGIGDLAIGSPQEPVKRASAAAGAVAILYGTRAQGLSRAGAQIWTQGNDGLPDGAQAGDEFGAALAAGNFNGDDFTALAIGAPGNGGDFGKAVGAVHIVFGGPTGLTATGNFMITERNVNTALREALRTIVEPGTRFGSVLAAGDFDLDGNGHAELAVGVPFGNARGLTHSGFVAVFRNLFPSTDPIPGTSADFFDQTRLFGSAPDPLVGSPTRSDTQFGFSLAAGDFNGDGRADLAVGAPFEVILIRKDTGFEFVDKAGEVDVIYGSSAGLSATSRPPQAWRLGMPGIVSQPAPNDLFGYSLTAWNFGRNEATVATADLAVGIPFRNVDGRSNAGAVQVLYGSARANGLSSANNQLWTQSSAGVPGGPETGDGFGQALY